MGEIRVLGSRPGWGCLAGRSRRSGRSLPGCQRLDIMDGAVATSGGYGFRFDAQGRFNHLFDPRSGGSAHRYRSVTVVMPTATAADALSTAFNLMPLANLERSLKAVGQGEVHLITATGERRVVRC